MPKTEATELKQQEAVAAIQGNLQTLSHHALHLKVDPTNERVTTTLTAIDQTKKLLPLVTKNKDPFVPTVEAHIGAHILHTADAARKKEFFNPMQADIQREDGYQHLNPALIHLQQFDAVQTQPKSYSTQTLQTIRALLPFVGPLPEDQRAFFEDVFMVEQQRLTMTAQRAQQFGQTLPREEADRLIAEIQQAFGMYKKEYLRFPVFAPEPTPVTTPRPRGERIRRQQLQPIPPYAVPPRAQRQYLQYPDAYPAYPQPRYREPQPRQYYPEPPAYMQPRGDYLNYWPWLPQRDAAYAEEADLPYYGPSRRNPQRW